MTLLMSGGGIFVATSPAHADEPPYELVNQYTGLCMGIQGAGTGAVDVFGREIAKLPFTPVIEWTCNGTDDKKWFFLQTLICADCYLIRNLYSSLCLGIIGVDNQPVQVGCNDLGYDEDIIWRIDNQKTDPIDGRPWGQLVEAEPYTNDHGLCMAIAGASQNGGGTALTLWTCNDFLDKFFKPIP